LVGSRDTPMLLAMADSLAANVPQVQRIDFPGVGHMINLEAAAAFNRAVLAFLGRP
jgi:pimeloyl-ACP methyl ester carboxylesterase